MIRIELYNELRNFATNIKIEKKLIQQLTEENRERLKDLGVRVVTGTDELSARLTWSVVS